MEIDELKEMIDGTVNENGRKEITGKALNHALNGIVDWVKDNAGSVKMPHVAVDGTELTAEQKASNAALYATLKDAVVNDGKPPISAVKIVAEGMAGIFMTSYFTYSAEDETVSMYSQASVLTLAADGSATLGF